MMIVTTLNTAARRLPTWAVYIGLALPGVLYVYWLFTNQLGSDPIRAFEHQVGEWALMLIMFGLLITPLRDWFKVNLIKFRRSIGLMAFFYTMLHLVAYLVFDQGLYWSEIWKDIVKRPYITFGMVSAVLMLPLAVTSNNISIRKMGPQVWNKLHRLVYLAAVGAVMHYLLLTKTWEVEPAVYAVILAVLLGHRVRKVRTKRGGARKRASVG
ncbi:protein-methionine-sulfoxide reductase heme-binding subunit MsrQ [Amylibacter marinus]|uniref:Protein-methionine-sulfoxide reductase heme-binding subunit MsrQ n=1 Tax=Amylibacter marinus TaxID=1475483 RepID=A0ABQ5VWV1_9RHOB|nr:protein-methionine-sulfoxide reductase heme-binding subunit MsrQ [Amylibacter marinus]GLQ35784.1 protein-methionine-sulfoxide reductase heme-binding subunit MsrQ [Amylibacter marinus]